MKRLFLSLVFLLLVFNFCPNIARAQDNQVDVYFFMSQTCPHCHDEKLHLESLQNDYPNMVVHTYEISIQANRNLLSALANAYDTTTGSVPMTFIGDKVIHGAQLDQITEQIKNCTENICVDPGSKAPTELQALEQTQETESSNSIFTYSAIAAVIVVAGIALYVIFKK